MDQRSSADQKKPTLEDFIIDMETRPPDNEDTTDVWAQLQQKEADLLLAAELGKALLEKNEDLKKQLDKTIEDYNAKIEKLEQDKHVLRRQLEVSASENDSHCSELQADISEMKTKLESQEALLKQCEREKNALIEELTAQNSRLSQELQKSNTIEMQLQTQLQEFKEQCSRRNMSIQDHVNSLDSLKSELKMILEKKNELEHRLQISAAEKETLQTLLSEASDRIHTLERGNREQETKYKITIQTLDRLERENGTLSERLESFDSQRSNTDHQSLLHEMGCDDLVDENSTPLLLKEAFTVFKQLKTLCQTLKSGHDDDSGLHSDISMDGSSLETTTPSQPSDSNNDTKFKRGMLSSITDDLVHTIMNLDAIQFKSMFEQTRNVVLEQEEELKRRQNRVMELESKLSVSEIELASAKEERNRARNDASNSTLAQDEVVSQARQDRDQAIERRTKAEIELAKTRVELMQANGQLLEAIQQKVELLQQLEQWQIDMHELIEEQMRNKLNDSALQNVKQQQSPQRPIRRSRLLDFLYR
ncbi:bicaudal D-related protein homolog [Culicoides brevitarsis]|uniref:bicaudal D-related protein homolog n=1 Tax=Culicoides brevitarsis TaxID=469753 RepID=UPI00307B5A3C